MAEVQKKDPYKILFDAMAASGLTDEELKKYFPKAMNLWKSGASENDRRKVMEAMMGDPEFQKELRLWDDFVDYDFSGYEKPKEKDVKPGNLSSADMKNVEKFYTKAKQVIDPKGLLGNTELYDTAGSKTFEQLEEKIGSDYEGDWFGNLLKAFNYPDTPEGMEQLTQDFQTALTRMKNSRFMGKFGKAETPLRFMFGKTAEALDDGKKPTWADAGIDASTNILWAITPTKFLPGISSVLTKVSSAFPKAGKLADFVYKADNPQTVLGKIIKGVGTNAVAPVYRSAADYAVGTDTEREKEEGLEGRAIDAATGTAVNLATPALINKTVPLILNTLNRLNLNPKVVSYGLQKTSDFVNYGNKQTAANERLGDLLGEVSNAKRTAMLLAQRLNKQRNSVKPKDLGSAVANLPGILHGYGNELAGFVENAGGNLGQGVKDFIRSKANKRSEAYYREIMEMPETLWDFMAPYLSSYLVNRAGTNQVGERTRRLLDRKTDMFIEE